MPLLVNFVYALVAAGLGALLAQRVRMPPMTGYILAGFAIGPFTPGFVGDEPTISALADIGVVFLMFAIGSRLPLRDLRLVGRTATIGGLIQVAVLVALGTLVGLALGFRPLESVFLGAVVSNSSSTVLTKLLGDRGEVDSEHGRLSLAWSSMQDLTTVAFIVILSSIASTGSPDFGQLLFALGRAALFLGVLVFAGGWAFERFLGLQTVLASREVFVIALAAGALAVAYLSTKFGLSLALGAFAAGLVVAESDVAHHALSQITPLRDVFAGLFFVSVGMLVHPTFVLHHALEFILVLALIIVVKGLFSALVARMLGTSVHIAILSAAALSQCAEFSFLLARLGVNLGVVSTALFNLLLSASVASVLLAPLVNRGARALLRRLPVRHIGPAELAAPTPPSPVAIVCGYGRVGSAICAALEEAKLRFTVIDEHIESVRALRARQIDAVLGDASHPVILERAGIASARLVVIAIPSTLEVRAILDHTRSVAPHARTVIRTHSTDEHILLTERGAWRALVGEVELARAMTRASLEALEVPPESASAFAASAPRPT